MSTEKRRNRRLPPDWKIFVNEEYVSEFEASSIKFADQLERRAAELKDRGFADDKGSIAVHLLVTPEPAVITRALQIMRKRGFSVTGGDKLPGTCSADFSVRYESDWCTARCHS